MSWFSAHRRFIGVAVSAAIVATSAIPASAEYFPSAHETVQPLDAQYAVRRKRRGGGNNQALGAAIVLGAAALGAAAIISSQQRKKRHAYYYAPPHPGYAYGHGYAPVYHQPQVYYAPQPAPQVYYAPQPAQRVYHGPRAYHAQQSPHWRQRGYHAAPGYAYPRGHYAQPGNTYSPPALPIEPATR